MSFTFMALRKDHSWVKWEHATFHSTISEIDRPGRVAPHYRLRFCRIRITDANRTKVVNVPTELTEHMGIFKDMLDTVSSVGDSEPVFSPS